MSDLTEESANNADELKAHENLNTTQETEESDEQTDERDNGVEEHNINESQDTSTMAEIKNGMNDGSKMNHTIEVEDE